MVQKELKKRVIYVYPNSDDQAERWKNLSRKAKVPVSKFVVDHVENSLAQEEKEEYEPRAALRKRIQSIEEENKELRKQGRILGHAVDRLEKENRRFREKQWTENSTGIRTYERKLIDILRDQGPLKDEEILSRLGIEATEVDSVTAVSNQLASLQSWGLVRMTHRGWRWAE